MNEKGRDDYSDDIGRTVYDLTWRGELWGRGGAIAWSITRYKYLRAMNRERQGLSALSSTYYTVWGNCIAKAVSNWFFAVFWVPLAILCLRRALQLSDEVDQKSGGIKNMSFGELLVRGSILAAAFFRRGRYKMALECLNEALNRENISNDNLALLGAKLGEVYDGLGDRAKANDSFCKAMSIKPINPTTFVRVYKSAARSLLKNSRAIRHKETAGDLLRIAKRVAEENNLGDQIVKITALMKKVG